MVKLLPDELSVHRFEQVPFKRVNNGYADIIVTASGTIRAVVIKGEYKWAIDPDTAIGRQIVSLNDDVGNLMMVISAVTNTLLTGAPNSVYCTIRGRKRIGMTIPCGDCVVIRLFVPMNDTA